VALAMLDVATVFASFIATGLIYHTNTEIARNEALVLSPVMILVGMYSGLYNPNLIYSLRRAAWRCLYVLALSATFVILMSFFAKTTATFSRVVLTFGCATTFVTMLAVRAMMARLARRVAGPSLHNTLIIQAGGPEVNIDHAYYLNVDEHAISSVSNDPTNLDKIGRFMENMDRVIVSCPVEERDSWAPMLRSAGVEGEFVSLELWRLGASELRNEHGFSGIVVSVQPLGLGARVVKRLLDLVLTSLALAVLSPLLLVVAILIWMEDGGPVFFRQRRMGAGNRLFLIYKFRSMRTEASDAEATRLTSRDDNRTTRIGRFIRRTSIDELPQLFNVWRGDMSLVGPRPHALGALAGEKLYWEVDGSYWSRHALKPGITGLAQIRGFRGSTEREQDLADRLQADLEYISSWSLWLDIQILVRTATVMAHHNAF
jgi:exopolysaccharide biosynthesis polyprenyl glycosylphosphotransferase